MYQCSGCGKNFRYVGPHKKHRIGSHERRERTCMTTEAMIGANWTEVGIKTGKDAGKTFWRMPAKEGATLPNFADFGKESDEFEDEEEEDEEDEQELPD